MKTLRAIVVLVAAAFLGAMAQAAPRLTISDGEFDFGFAPQNSQVTHVFWLHSTGDDSLKIIKVTPGCGCTQTPLQKENLAAGDSTQLEVVFSTGMYSNRVTKTPRIATNEGPPDKLVRITTDVVTNPDSTYPVVVHPYKLDLSQFGEKVRDEIKFTIHNVSTQPLTPTLIYSPSDFIEVTLPKQIGAGKTAEGTVKIRKEHLDKPFIKSFTLQMDDEKKSRFTVPVTRSQRSEGVPMTVGVPAGH
jgi:hypothetical protein